MPSVKVLNSYQEDIQPPDVLTINCTSLTNTLEIFEKILGDNQPQKKRNSLLSPLKSLQISCSQTQKSSGMKMMLVIADELDYLITRDRGVLHDLFMLTTLPSCRCILIGIANAIDLADRFLPKLQSLNCKPMVVTFRAYSKDQIIMILRQRLRVLSYTVFQPQALELCARRVAAASGDMRKALSVCRSAIEILEAEHRQSTCNLDTSSLERVISDQQTTSSEIFKKQDNCIVRVDHMAIALSKAYRSPIVETIQSLPQHQQIILCSAVKLFRKGKKDTTIGELNKSYLEICKSTSIPSVGIMELSSMCRVLGDQDKISRIRSIQDESSRNDIDVDALSVVLGRDKRGRTRGVGKVPRTTIKATRPIVSELQQVKNDMHLQRDLIERQTSIIEKQNARLDNMEATFSSKMDFMINLIQNHSQMQRVPSFGLSQMYPTRAPTPHPNPSQLGSYKGCYYIRDVENKKNIGVGRIFDSSPGTIVHCRAMVALEAKVKVLDIYPGMENEKVYLGQQGGADTIQDFRDLFVVWPINLLEKIV